jgi:hypothetical protein
MGLVVMIMYRRCGSREIIACSWDFDMLRRGYTAFRSRMQENNSQSWHSSRGVLYIAHHIPYIASNARFASTGQFSCSIPSTVRIIILSSKDARGISATSCCTRRRLILLATRSCRCRLGDQKASNEAPVAFFCSYGMSDVNVMDALDCASPAQ